MRNLEWVRRDGVVELILVRGRGNALDGVLLRELERVFDDLDGDAAPPVVIRAEGTSFCTGLDLEDAARHDRGGMRELMIAFHRALAAAFAHPAPTIAAIGGHALAGGALLAFCADVRLMAHGAGRFGVHGVQLGVAYPDAAVEVLRHQLAPRPRQSLLYEGRLHTDAGAYELGWIDELVESDRLVERARERAGALNAPSAGAFAATKARLRRPAIERLRSIDTGGMDRWLDRWFAPDTVARREEALIALRERRGTRPGENPAHHED
ncbi:MAG TPA: enoyl-CoA hydratase/isomerase family protein [Candidatus Krumholzibacteria bacterium]|nr:enoyl-CoA hydratase/isomerase family protein [Candidatus Krumholzibacteria bacterium]